MKRSLLLDLSFGGIALIIFGNLNGIANLLFGVTAAFSSLILVFCLFIIYYLFRYKKITFPHYAFNAALVLLFVIGTVMWMFYSHMYHKNADYYKVFRKTAPALILAYAVYKYMIYAADRGKLNSALYFITFTLLLVTLMIPLVALTNIVPGSFRTLVYGGGRSAGLFASPNLAGIHANFTLAFVLFFTLTSKRFYLLFLSLIPLTYYAGILTFSKATIIAGGLMIVLFFIYNLGIILKMPSARRRRFSTTLVVVIMVIIAFLPKIQEYSSQLQYAQLKRIEQIGSLLQGNFDSESTTARSVLWGEAIELISAQPFLGYGLSCFHNLPENLLGSHNTYLMIWGEGGILPFIAMLIFIGSVTYRSFFWIRDPAFRFLALSLILVIVVQMYGAAHNGFSNSEVVTMTAIVFALVESQRGRIGHLRYGKYVGRDHQLKLSKKNGHLH